MSSLQEQLLKAGLVDKNRANKAKKEKQKQDRASRQSNGQKNQNPSQLQQQRQQKQQHDRALNQQKQHKNSQRALNAEIKQLIEANRIDRQGGELAYSFVDGKKIRKVYVTEALKKQLVDNRLAIARYQRDGALAYELVPVSIAEKIAQRDEKAVVVQKSSADQSSDQDDAYADYQIPDDLMW